MTPFVIEAEPEPYRARLAVWMELPDALVLAQALDTPAGARDAVARALRAALDAPLVGEPRRPTRVRISDPALAVDVRAVLGPSIPIEIAPTPELDELLEHMAQHLGRESGEEPSYLEYGGVAEPCVRELFRSAEQLYRIAPWEVACDSQVLRMDIPRLGVEGACVSIIGNLGESLGVVIFPSYESYEAFTAAAEELPAPGQEVDFGTGLLALSFERAADLPESLRREVMTHGWPMANPDAYPWAARRNREGVNLPLEERDVRIASACAATLGTFFLQNREIFESDY